VPNFECLTYDPHPASTPIGQSWPGDLKLRDVSKFYFFKLDYDEIELQKITYDVILVT